MTILINFNSLLDLKETFKESYYNYKKIDFRENLKLEEQFDDLDDLNNFYDLFGQLLYNNKETYLSQYNEIISLANESLYPVYFYLEKKIYQKQYFHLSNLLSRQRDLIISGFFFIEHYNILKENVYIYDEEIKDDNNDFYNNSLCLFFKDIEQKIKKSL